MTATAPRAGTVLRAVTEYPCCAGCGSRPVGPNQVLCRPCGALAAMADPFPFAAPTLLVDATLVTKGPR